MKKKYYLGLDLGTGSVGWAVTDEHYQLLRAKGKDLWGVRLFDTANTAEKRRINRVSRRRRQREKARIGYIKEIFAEEINKVDPGFLQRLEDSKYWQEDKREKQPFALFADSGFTDKDYYKKYPTIFHLRKELIESEEVHDIRLVYLAILNIYKHRGHFLNESLSDGQMGNLEELYAALQELTDSSAWDVGKRQEFEQLLVNKKLSRLEKVNQLRELLNIKKNSCDEEMLKLICGLKGRIDKIFPGENREEQKNLQEKQELSFMEGDIEQKIDNLEEELEETQIDILWLLKSIHDWRLLAHIMQGEKGVCAYLSQARVEAYEKHHQDLLRLKKVYRLYAADKFNKMFRIMGGNNYSDYVGSVCAKEQLRRRDNRKLDTEGFFKQLKKDVMAMPEDEDTAYILHELDKGTFLPKQLTSDNGVIPNQIHKAELKKILRNAEAYLPFLAQKDDSGLSASERIISLFAFQIPYYIGPLRNTETNGAWVVRRNEEGRIFPWNFSQKVDEKKTAEEFKKKLINHCTYLNQETVLPKQSLLYERFMVLNELNNLKINGEKISVELKQELYRELFAGGKKVTGKRVESYLKQHGYVEKSDKVVLEGIEQDFKCTLANHAKFTQIFGVKSLNIEQIRMAEQLISWATIYGNSKDYLREQIQEYYGEQLNTEQIKRLLGMKFKDWGRLSRQLLEMEGADKATGEKMTIIQRMWEENYNLMELLSGNFTYWEEIQEKTIQLEKSLEEIEYEDLQELYLSVPVKRIVWQTLLILKELRQVLGTDPERIFIEMARGEEMEKTRKDSRKKKLEKLYKSCGEEGKFWSKKLESIDEAQLRQKKLYLYYLQMGKCMYTGEPIDLGKLFYDNFYDIDHIYPKHFVKDDSIENNLILVKKEENSDKKDEFPIKETIRKNMRSWWEFLKEKELINLEKYKRLTRHTPFTVEEQAGFISRQLVETRQGTKTVAELLKKIFPASEVVYVKADNVSQFRDSDKKYKSLIKCREVNDFHHAHDAYLNIVVGNVYDTKFTKNPIHFVREYKENPDQHKYHMYYMFNFDVIRGDRVAWKAGEAGSIRTVKAVLQRNTVLVTRRSCITRGKIAEQTIYSAKKAAKGTGYIPIKSSDTILREMSKYGGYTTVTGSKFFLVEHEEKGKRIRTLEVILLPMEGQLDTREKLEDYCEKQLGYQKASVRIQEIKMGSLIKVDGFYLYLTGRSQSRLSVTNAVQMILSQEQMYYVKRMKDLMDRNLTEEQLELDKIISREKNLELYYTLMQKHKDGIYGKRPNSIGKKLTEGESLFKELEIKQQIFVLLQILMLSQRSNNGVDLRNIGGSKQAGVATLNKKITEKEEFKLINQSVTGLYENEIDLLRV